MYLVPHFFKISFQFSTLELETAFNICMSYGREWTEGPWNLIRVSFLVPNKSVVTTNHPVSPESRGDAGDL